MSWKQTKQRTFQSRYSESYVTIAQYITEYMCEICAKKANKELPRNFWKDNQEWKKYFRYQVTIANKLIKQYHPRSIVRILRKPEARCLTSLVGLEKIPRLHKLLKIEHKKAIEEDRQPVRKTEKIEARSVRKPYRTGKNKLAKLKEL